MPLIKCKECGAQVSTEASTCPHCGAKRDTRASYLWIFIGVPVGAVALFLGFGFLNMTPEKSRDRAAIDECWRSADMQLPFSEPKIFASKACKMMVSDYENKHGRAPSLRRE